MVILIFLLLKKGGNYFNTNFFLFFKANCEECPSPPSKRARGKANCEECPSPPSKRARVQDKTHVRESVIQYGRCPMPSSSTLPAQASSAQPGRKPKREWMDTFNAAVAENCEVAYPSSSYPTLSRVSGTIQNHEVALEHTLPGPSGTQVQPGFANVSIFPTYLIEIHIYFFQCFLVFSFHYFSTLCKSVSQRY